MAGDVRIYHKDSFSGVILEQLGFARPAEQDLPDFAEKGVTKERIPAMDGDMMFYFTYETGDKEATSEKTRLTSEKSSVTSENERFLELSFEHTFPQAYILFG